jgi:hypothetical protein
VRTYIPAIEASIPAPNQYAGSLGVSVSHYWWLGDFSFGGGFSAPPDSFFR